MRKNIGAINTETLLLIGGAAAAVYFLTRPKVAAVPYGYNPATGLPYPGAQTALSYSQQQQPNQTAQTITAISTGLSALANAAGNFF